MTSFLQIPVDILSRITFYTSGMDIGCLFLCCNKKLNHALIHGGVTHFVHILNPQDHDKTLHEDGFRWPSIVHKLQKLQKLTISINGSENYHFFDMEIISLECLFSSTTLTELRLYFNIRDELDLSCLKTVSSPTLRHLEVCFNRSDDMRQLQSFPPQLVYLSVDWQITDHNVALLPQGLKTLLFNESENFTDVGIQGLPNTITHLELYSMENDIHYSLTQLMITMNNTNNAYNTLTNASIKSLPSGLIVLNLGSNKDIDDDGIAHLPNTLKKLKLQWNRNVTDKGVALLPQVLEKIDLRRNRNLTDACIPDLPKTLKKLFLPLGVHLTDACVGFLPRTLEKIVLFQNTRFTDDAIGLLPRQLKHLNLASNEKFTDACVTFLPPTLTILEWNNNIHLTDQSIISLPRTITHLNLNANQNLTDACIPDLPPNLQEFQLCANIEFTDAGVALLPNSLTILNLAENRKLTARCVGDLPPGLIIFNSILKRQWSRYQRSQLGNTH